MKFSAVVLVAAAAVATAQSISDIPECARTCLIGALGKTGCELTDFKCSCTNKDFVDGGAACIDKACGDDDIAKARSATIAICGKAGVEINPPQKGGDKPTSAAAPAPSSAAPVVSSAAPVVSSAAPVVSSAAPAVSSSVAPVAPGYGSVTTSKAASTAATTVRPSVIPGNGTVPQPPPTYTGAAAAIAGNAVLAIGGAVAAFFL